MLEIESRLDLQLDREQELLARWGTRRLQVERDLQLCHRDPSLPASFKEDLDFNADVLDTMLSRAPERFRTFGAEVVAIGSLRMLESLIHEIQENVSQAQLDPGGFNG